MEPFKNLIDAATVRTGGAHLQRVWPGFERERFEALALDGLDGLEFKARARHLCDALEATLPRDFCAAADIIEASLAPVGPGEDIAALRSSAAGLAGWVVWPMAEFVARRGLDSPTRALRALHALTQRHTAEWSIRPFIEQHPQLAFETLQAWTRDPSPHVRRLVSEGSRPRLPWGVHLRRLIADPSPTLPLLLALQDDTSAYVRRSVANHLNDIAKDHPALVVQWVAQHLPGAPPTRMALLRHASRTLIKRGDAPMLEAWGLGLRLTGTATLRIEPAQVDVGGEVTLVVDLRSTAARAQKLVIDYAVHHVRADGGSSAKVFKGWGLDLAAHEQRRLQRRHSLRPITTRTYRAGAHAVDLRINGAVVASARFDLRL